MLFRSCVSAGEPLNPEVIEAWQRATGLMIYEGYGQTESIVLVANVRSSGQEVRIGSMGHAMPGYDVQTHKHTGPVYAFTTSGAWRYKESDFVNTAGSFLYEPAGSVHTLTVPADNTEPTEVFFAIWGANLNLDADGNVESIVDAGIVLQGYSLMCEAAGLPKPDVVLD